MILNLYKKLSVDTKKELLKKKLEYYLLNDISSLFGYKPSIISLDLCEEDKIFYWKTLGKTKLHLGKPREALELFEKLKRMSLNRFRPIAEELNDIDIDSAKALYSIGLYEEARLYFLNAKCFATSSKHKQDAYLEIGRASCRERV